MKQVFKALEIEASENEIQKMINQMDQDGDFFLFNPWVFSLYNNKLF